MNEVYKAITEISRSIRDIKFIVRHKTKRYWRIGRKVMHHPFAKLINQDFERRQYKRVYETSNRLDHGTERGDPNSVHC